MSFFGQPLIEVDLTLTPEENFIKLLNDVCEITLGVDDIRIGQFGPHPDYEAIGATQITVWPAPDSQYVGSAVFSYRRLDIARIVSDRLTGIDVQDGDTLDTLLSWVAQTAGLLPDQLRLDVENIEDLKGDNAPESVTFHAIDDSLTYVGSLELLLRAEFQNMFRSSTLDGFAYDDELYWNQAARDAIANAPDQPTTTN